MNYEEFKNQTRENQIDYLSERIYQRLINFEVALEDLVGSFSIDINNELVEDFIDQLNDIKLHLIKKYPKSRDFRISLEEGKFLIKFKYSREIENKEEYFKKKSRIKAVYYLDLSVIDKIYVGYIKDLLKS